MTLKSLALGLVLAAGCAAAASAQVVFDVKLGAKKLGTFSYGNRDGTQSMQMALSSTPFGVFNGAMSATSRSAGGVQTFNAETGAERKTRTVLVTHKAGRAVETIVAPAAQMTPLSNPARVPAGILDPVQAIGKLVEAPSCPDGITIYDGRRAVALTLTEAAIKDGTQTCKLSYRVVAGPPHLSPLNVSKAKMTLFYTVAPRALARMDISNGPLKVKLERRR